MTPEDQPKAVPPPQSTISALMRGFTEKIDHDLSELAWLLASRPETLPPGSIETLLRLASTIHELERQIRD